MLLFKAMMCLLLLGAEPQPQKFSTDQLNRLVELRENAELIIKLQKNGVKVDQDNVAMKSILSEAKNIAGVSEYSELVDVTGGDNKPPTVSQQMLNLVTFTNVLSVLGSLIFGSALLLLFGAYFFDLLVLIPKNAWELTMWILSFSLAVLSFNVTPSWQLFLLMPACLASLTAACLTLRFHWIIHTETDRKPYEIMLFILSAFWAYLAVASSSHVVGFMSIMALLGALGFICGHIPGVSFIGFQSYEVVARTTIAGGLILALHVLLLITATNSVAIDAFREGMSFMGSTVYFTGILIMSSKSYSYISSYNRGRRDVHWPRYWSMQVLTILSGLLALYLGSVFNISTLSGIGGTLFCLYILEKYYEIPWKGMGYYWSLFGLGTLLYTISVCAQTYPQYFIFGGKTEAIASQDLKDDKDVREKSTN